MFTEQFEVDRKVAHLRRLDAVVVKVIHERDMGRGTFLIPRGFEAGYKGVLSMSQRVRRCGKQQRIALYRRRRVELQPQLRYISTQNGATHHRRDFLDPSILQ